MSRLTFLLLLLTIAASEQLHLTPTQLEIYDGSEAKSIYLAINGTIYDVSAAPTFYGPGASYHHFAGRDASRAWVTECWDSTDQLTWRMDDIHEMFMPKYLDEELEKVASGEDPDLDLGGIVEREQIEMIAMAALRRLGKVSTEEKAARRDEDKVEANQKVHDKLKHWTDFFQNNQKYKVVGSMVFDGETSPSPPALCDHARQMRPLKGGKLDALINVEDMGRKHEGESGVPPFVKAAWDLQVDEKSDKQIKNEL